jgi:hypothetical protein
VRLNIWAAIAPGILLPDLETLRRGFGHWFISFTTMFEDYLAGAALLVAAGGVLRKARWAPMMMVIAWSGMFMMLISTVSQIEHHFWSTDPEPRSGVVLAIKLVLLAISAVALAQSVKEARAT